MYILDDPTVGSGGSGWFKPALNVKNRISILPGFISLADLTVSPEMEELAKKDPKVAAEAAQRKRMHELIQKGLEREAPSTQKWTNDKGEEGYLYSKVEAAYIHWHDSGPFFCKATEGACCCERSSKEKAMAYGLIAIVYQTDVNGDPVARANPEVTADGKLDFNYSLQIWNLTEAKMRAFKESHSQYPPIFSDYIVGMEPSGKMERLKVSNTPKCLWRSRGLEVQRRIIREGLPLFAKIYRGLAQKDYSVPEIATLFGQGTPPGRSEEDYGSLLNI